MSAHISINEYLEHQRRQAAPTKVAARTARSRPTPPATARAGGPSKAVIGLDSPPVVLRVIGSPRTQGSKQAIPRKDGKGMFYREGGGAEAHAKFKSWRSAVADEGRRWLITNGHPAPYDGAVRIDMLFLLPKPPSRPKRERLPRTSFDRDKLERAVHDGLSVDALVIANDSRVCWGEIGKLWAVDTSPGVVVRIEAIDEDAWRSFPLADLVWSDAS